MLCLLPGGFGYPSLLVSPVSASNYACSWSRCFSSALIRLLTTWSAPLICAAFNTVSLFMVESFPWWWQGRCVPAGKKKWLTRPVGCPEGQFFAADRLWAGPRSCRLPAGGADAPGQPGLQIDLAGGAQVVRYDRKPARVAVYGAAVDVGMRTCGPLLHPLCKLTYTGLSADSTMTGYVV